jgi:hypothetical protein
VLPRYENSSVVGIFIPFICIGGGFCVFKVITSVLFWLMFSPICCANLLTRDEKLLS